MSHLVASTLRIVVSEMGEQTFPKVAPPRAEPTQWSK